MSGRPSSESRPPGVTPYVADMIDKVERGIHQHETSKAGRDAMMRLMYESPEGYTIREIAAECRASRVTVMRKAKEGGWKRAREVE